MTELLIFLSMPLIAAAMVLLEDRRVQSERKAESNA